MNLYTYFEIRQMQKFFEANIGGKFYFQAGARSELFDVFYMKEPAAERAGADAPAYSVLCYFRNGSAVKVERFLTLNQIDAAEISL